MTPDILNAAFEFIGGCMIANNIRVLIRHKQVRGVSKLTVAFFMAWGCWNVFYYPHLDQMWSFAAGLFICVVNAVWLGLMLWYAQHGARP